MNTVHLGIEQWSKQQNYGMKPIVNGTNRSDRWLGGFVQICDISRAIEMDLTLWKKGFEDWMMDMGGSINGGTQTGWYIMENPVKIDDLGVPLFKETSIWGDMSLPKNVPERSNGESWCSH